MVGISLKEIFGDVKEGSPFDAIQRMAMGEQPNRPKKKNNPGVLGQGLFR